MYKAGIVILNYNDADTVFNLMDVISDYKSISHIVIVDNCSKDDSYIRLKKLESDRCTVIESDKNGGYSYGNNIGLRYLIDKCKCDYLFIANPDVSFEDKVIETIVQAFIENEEYGVFSGVMKNAEGKVYRNAFFQEPSYALDIINCCILTRVINKKVVKAKIDYSVDIMEVGILPGSFFGIRANALKEINYLDEGTFLFCEEIILKARLVSKGYKSGLITNIDFLHLHSVSLKKTTKEIDILKHYQKALLHYYNNYTNVKGIKIKLLKIAFKYAQIETYIVHPIKVLINKII